MTPIVLFEVVFVKGHLLIGTQLPLGLALGIHGFADSVLSGNTTIRTGCRRARWQLGTVSTLGFGHGIENSERGPNSGLGHNSVVVMAEAGIAHLLAALRHLRTTGATAMEPSAQAQARFVAEVDRRMKGSVWTAGGCRSWYLDRTGRNSTLWPGFTIPFRRRLGTLQPDDYILTTRTPAAEVVP